jgi:hypothetical protein
MEGGSQQPRPNLRIIHTEASFSPRSLAFWRLQAIDYIVDSLRNPAHPNYQALRVRADGMVRNGNTRLYVLLEKGFDIDTIPWNPDPE